MFQNGALLKALLIFPPFLGQNISFIEKAIAGLVGGALAVCIGTPFDVTLVRMQADTMKPKVSV